LSTGLLGASFSAEEVSRKVVELLYRFRRSIDVPADVAAADPCRTAPCAECIATYQPKIDHFTNRFEPIHFVIPAFPAKSPNRTKVLGVLPDLGEQMALEFLQSLCDYVSHFYAPGARVTICSDGHVFGDVVGVTDTAVTAYRDSLTSMIRAGSLRSLDLFGLDDAFGGANYRKLRQRLEDNYAASLDDLKARIATEDKTRALFNGIHRFMFEDGLATRGATVSKTALRNQSKEAAYHTIRRSNAWSRVVAENFPRAVRLSIHPQPTHSDKLGLHLIRTKDSWLTPWHGVVLDDGTTLALVKRWDAEKLKASIVWRNGRPSHYVAPHLTIKP